MEGRRWVGGWAGRSMSTRTCCAHPYPTTPIQIHRTGQDRVVDKSPVIVAEIEHLPLFPTARVYQCGLVPRLACPSLCASNQRVAFPFCQDMMQHAGKLLGSCGGRQVELLDLSVLGRPSRVVQVKVGRFLKIGGRLGTVHLRHSGRHEHSLVVVPCSSCTVYTAVAERSPAITLTRRQRTRERSARFHG